MTKAQITKVLNSVHFKRPLHTQIDYTWHLVDGNYIIKLAWPKPDDTILRAGTTYSASLLEAADESDLAQIIIHLYNTLMNQFLEIDYD